MDYDINEYQRYSMENGLDWFGRPRYKDIAEWRAEKDRLKAEAEKAAKLTEAHKAARLGID